MQLNRNIIIPDIWSLLFSAHDGWTEIPYYTYFPSTATLDMSPQIAANTLALFRVLTVYLFQPVGCR